MELFIDSANLDEIKAASAWGLIDGVTTNPSLMAKEGRSTAEVITEICNIIDGPISAEVVSLDCDGMIKEGQEFAKIHDNVTIKLPMTEEGVKACKWFSSEGIKTNITLVFSPTQALMAAKNGATFVSPFIGRLDDIGHLGMQVIDEIRTIFDNYGYPTKILAASIRHTQHVRDAALVGADVSTCPYKVLQQLFKHPLTDNGLEKFMSDYRSTLK